VVVFALKCLSQKKAYFKKVLQNPETLETVVRAQQNTLILKNQASGLFKERSQKK